MLRKENKIWGFKGQYKNSQETRPGVDEARPNSINNFKREKLEFKEVEVLIALVDLLEGGLVSFLAKPIVRSDVMGFLEELLLTGFFKESLNTIFLMLVSRKGKVEDIKDFWFISLVGGLYNLLAKSLLNTLKKVIS